MAGIFISYRRDDSAGHAGRLYDALVAALGEERVFRDVDTIELGRDFIEVIEEALNSVDIVLVVISKEWLGARNRQRLANPDDYLRLEISRALARSDVRVIPVLVQGVAEPPSDRLPDDLKPLATRRAVELRDTRWHDDVDNLVTALRKILDSLAAERPSPTGESEDQSETVNEARQQAEAIVAEAEARTAELLQALRSEEQEATERIAVLRATLTALEARHRTTKDEHQALTARLVSLKDSIATTERELQEERTRADEQAADLVERAKRRAQAIVSEAETRATEIRANVAADQAASQKEREQTKSETEAILAAAHKRAEEIIALAEARSAKIVASAQTTPTDELPTRTAPPILADSPAAHDELPTPTAPPLGVLPPGAPVAPTTQTVIFLSPSRRMRRSLESWLKAVSGVFQVKTIGFIDVRFERYALQVSHNLGTGFVPTVLSELSKSAQGDLYLAAERPDGIEFAFRA